MSEDAFGERAQKARKALDLLARNYMATLPSSLHEAVDRSIEDLQVAIEELQVADEELRAQNQELVETRRAVEVERGRYRNLFDLAPDGYLVTNVEGLIEEVNHAAATQLNVAEGFLVGKPLAVFVAEEERPAFRQQLDLLRTTDRLEWDLRLTPREKPAFAAAVTVIVARPAAGSAPALRWLVRDVTLHRRVEEQLAQSRKMEAIGRLAGGVAHDFNNLLTVILGHADRLGQLSLPDPAPHHAEQVQSAAERAANLTYRLLAFSRKQTLLPRILDLNALIVETQRILMRTIGEDIEVDLSLAPDLSRVRADPTQVEQVVMNLVLNARDAMPRGGRLALSTADVVVDGSQGSAGPDVPAGRYVVLSVEDTGSGMDAATQAHLFEPFYTTKEVGRGTGLGLATVHGIVHQSEGHVTVASAPGQGTTFRVYLPRVEGALGLTAGAIAEMEALSGTETILCVEDEESLRALFRTVLAECGYTVLDAANGKEAVRIAREHRGPIHLLVTDVIMPGLDGPELARRIAASRPETKVLYMSGYTAAALDLHGGLGAETTLLEKPFTPDTLQRRVRQVLDSSHASPPRATGGRESRAAQIQPQPEE